MGIINRVARFPRCGQCRTIGADQTVAGLVVHLPVAGNYAAGSGHQEAAANRPQGFVLLPRAIIRIAGAENR